MAVSFADATTLITRNIKYLLRRPKPPVASKPFDGPVLVVGSAPISNKPDDFDHTFKVITINGSQAVTKKWGIASPDVTLIQHNQMDGTNTNAVAVRQVLKGERTEMLYILLWRKGRVKLEQRLKDIGYQYGKLQIVNRYERIAILEKVSGLKLLELDKNNKCSNGVIAAVYALYNGATAVIITGINPNSNGHIYNQANLSRFHAQTDKEVLVTLVKQGHPLYTTDREVSESIGIPLWMGREARQVLEKP